MLKRRIRSLIGLDIGSKAVKAVELTWSGGLVITGFGYAELPAPDAVPDTVARQERHLPATDLRDRQRVAGRSPRGLDLDGVAVEEGVQARSADDAYVGGGTGVAAGGRLARHGPGA
jgi:hypothetical protein